jgi:hypothetical protein
VLESALNSTVNSGDLGANSGAYSGAYSGVNLEVNSGVNSVDLGAHLGVNLEVISGATSAATSAAHLEVNLVDSGANSAANSDQESSIDWDQALDPEEAEIEALELKRQESTDWRSLPHKYLKHINYAVVHPEELNALGKKEVRDAVLNKDGYLYYSQQVPRSKRQDIYLLVNQEELEEEARKAVTQVAIPPLSPLQIRRKRASSKKQIQLDKEAEERRQEQYQKAQRRLLQEDKYIELKEAADKRAEEEKQQVDRFRRRFARE